MKDKKAISIHKLAAIARAKALGLEVNRPGISSFERQALEWKRREQAQKSELSSEEHNPESPIQDPEPSIQNPRCRRDLRQVSNIQHPSFPHSAGSPPELRRTSPLRSDKHPSKLNEGFDWQSYRPEQDAAEKKPRDLNTASIALMARKIMAGEWAMALGKRIIDSDQAVIEGKAEKYRKKKAAERERKAIEEQKILKQRAILEETLLFFGRDLLKAPKPITPQAAEVLLAGALSELGECIKINWQPNICDILIEPWEERRMRRKNGNPIPALFQATIDDNFILSSYQKVIDPQLLQESRAHLIIKNILISFRKSAGRNFHALQDAVAEGGRIIQSMKTDGGWKIKLEPWEEMRMRNVERNGRPPIVTYVINADKVFNHISCERI